MTKASAKKASIAEWDALLARYPLATPADIGRQVLSVVASNALVLYLLQSGKLRPIHLVALVLFEALLLTGIAWIQSRTVPQSALMEKQGAAAQSLSARLFILAFGAVWLGFVYALILGAMLDAGGEALAALREPATFFRKDTLLWPLLLTLTFAVADAVRDWMHWRSVGGFFLSTPGFNAAARWLTLFLGGIPFFVPFAAGVWGLATGAEWLRKRHLGAGAAGRAAGTRVEKIAPFVVPLLFMGLFAVMGWLLSAGVSGWAVGYCSAKLLSESFLVFLPLIAHKARTEEAAELVKVEAAVSPKRRRKR